LASAGADWHDFLIKFTENKPLLTEVPTLRSVWITYCFSGKELIVSLGQIDFL
jgi:hypothetical protein